VGLAKEDRPARLAQRPAQDEPFLLQGLKLSFDGPQRLLCPLQLRRVRLHLTPPPERRLLSSHKVGLQGLGARGQLLGQPLYRDFTRRRAAPVRI
jgi:hypothetical protein